ncbi:MAG: hypothetical protein ACUVSF_05035 [Anaerolineae bacterium]
MVRPPQDEDATLISRSSDPSTVMARAPRSVQPTPPRRKGTPWLVWLVIVGLFVLICLASMAALLLFLRTDTLQAVQVRLTAAALTSEALRASKASGVGTPAFTTVTATAQAIPSPESVQSPVLPSMTGEVTPSPISSTAAMAMATPSPMPLLTNVDATSQPMSPTIVAATATPAPLPTLNPIPSPTTTPLPPMPSPTSPAIVTSPPPSTVSLSPTSIVQVIATGGDIIIAAATPSPVPILGTITFSAVTQDGRTVEGDTFVGRITEIHAVFTYQNMIDGMTWERRWFLNERQMAKVTEAWNKGSTGTFHLTLTAGGNPLSSGRWRLELYGDGKLLQQGECVIEEIPTPPPSLTATLPPTSVPSPTTAATTVPTVTPTATVMPVYTIAFSRWDGGKYDLFLARTDGSGEKFLLQRAAGPSWSPDGRYLIFFGQEGVDRQERDGITYHFEGISNGIISMDMRTWSPDPRTIVLRQHVREATARWAAWSPRGDIVAYDARRGGPDWRIYFFGTVDSQQSQVEIPGEQADWSPDGNYLVYRSGRENRQGIWVSNRDDSSRVQITAEGSDAFPRWSPDGRKIAFHRDSGQNVDIYVMNPDGSHVRRLTDAPGPDTLPAWTPDGRIVFRSARSGSWGIYIMNADSSGQRRIIPNADPGPDWAFGRMDVR